MTCSVSSLKKMLWYASVRGASLRKKEIASISLKAPFFFNCLAWRPATPFGDMIQYVSLSELNNDGVAGCHATITLSLSAALLRNRWLYHCTQVPLFACIGAVIATRCFGAGAVLVHCLHIGICVGSCRFSLRCTIAAFCDLCPSAVSGSNNPTLLCSRSGELLDSLCITPSAGCRYSTTKKGKKREKKYFGECSSSPYMLCSAL